MPPHRPTSALSPRLAPIVARLEALMERARRPDLGPGDLDEPLVDELNAIRALMAEAVAQECSAAGQPAAFSPSGLSALRPSSHAPSGNEAAPSAQPVRPGRL
jgi:hypothetical protein